MATTKKDAATSTSDLVQLGDLESHNGVCACVKCLETDWDSSFPMAQAVPPPMIHHPNVFKRLGIKKGLNGWNVLSPANRGHVEAMLLQPPVFPPLQ